MLAVLWFDGTRYLIPNWLVGSLLLLYPVAVYTGHGHADWKMALLGMAIVFVVGYFVFARKWMGGGDIKLLTACALWAGWYNLLDFLIMVALLGGVFAVLVWVLRKVLLHLPVKVSFRLLKDGEPIPYGVAIAVGFLIAMAQGQIPAIL
ncbi:MAG: prepilin peptidase [Pseudomonadota bacterium]|nr:prepilin peptidase [Pseudomonadota bacterium]